MSTQHDRAATFQCEQMTQTHLSPSELVLHICFGLQLKIIGPKYGMWGLRKYGTTLTLVDALVFWPDRLACLADLIKLEQDKARKLAVPSAFVTFKSGLPIHCSPLRSSSSCTIASA